MKLTFLHGFLGSPEDFKSFNLPGTFLTLPGHQGRPLDLTLLEKEISEKTVLIGYSLGGRLALHFAKRFPERIAGLVILSANPGLEGGLRSVNYGMKSGPLFLRLKGWNSS